MVKTELEIAEKHRTDTMEIIGEITSVVSCQNLFFRGFCFRLGCPELAVGNSHVDISKSLDKGDKRRWRLSFFTP